MSANYMENFRRFERKIIRRIYGPLKDKEFWRIRTNEEINNILQRQDIVRCIKSLRLGWLGHVQRMGDDRMPTRMLNNKMESNRGRGRPRKTWMQDVREDLEAMKIRGWRQKVLRREEWRRIVEEAKAHPGL